MKGHPFSFIPGFQTFQADIFTRRKRKSFCPGPLTAENKAWKSIFSPVLHYSAIFSCHIPVGIKQMGFAWKSAANLSDNKDLRIFETEQDLSRKLHISRFCVFSLFLLSLVQLHNYRKSILASQSHLRDYFSVTAMWLMQRQKTLGSADTIQTLSDKSLAHEVKNVSETNGNKKICAQWQNWIWG